MKIIKKSSNEQVYGAWLKSELFHMRPRLSLAQVRLIKEPDYGNFEENQERENILLNIYGRKGILDHVPKDIEWYEAEIEDQDLPKLYILACWDWFLDTGKTFELLNVQRHMTSGHGHKIPNLHSVADHKARIEKMLTKPNINTQGAVVISSSKKGVFTIIDGTHRLSFLAVKNTVPGTKVYLGIALDLSECVWAPEWKNCDKNIEGLSSLVDEGYFW